jgi:hypothetical protein
MVKGAILKHQNHYMIDCRKTIVCHVFVACYSSAVPLILSDDAFMNNTVVESTSLRMNESSAVPCVG